MNRSIKLNNSNYTEQTTFDYLINSDEELLLLNYLYRLHKKEIKHPKMKVIEFLAIKNVSSPSPKAPTALFQEHMQNYQFYDQIHLLTFIFNKKVYKITFSRTEEGYDVTLRVDRYIYINPISSNSDQAHLLFDLLSKESIKNSTFNKKTIMYSFQKGRFTSCLKIIDFPPIMLDSIFIPKPKIEQIKRFVSTIENFEKTHTNLRFLFSGMPGTGKTKIIQAIATALKEKATIVIVNSDFIPFRRLLDFCSVFDKALLIIDDIDFIAADRETSYDRGMLNVLLQTLDGFVPNHVFLLGSTNDKKLIDSAASRPGRFDLILDINEIEPTNYLSLVIRETSDEQIISFFDSSILEELRLKKVTGAYIVSLVKQLKNTKSNNEQLSTEKFREILSLTHKGFYSDNACEYSKAVGFNNN
ncbi:MAG: AAA family ATPase [Melioribacteraceae bacterium]|nr:AAA family ATPase [Melioribacteraceae bacterium]